MGYKNYYRTLIILLFICFNINYSSGIVCDTIKFNEIISTHGNIYTDKDSIVINDPTHGNILTIKQDPSYSDEIFDQAAYIFRFGGTRVQLEGFSVYKGVVDSKVRTITLYNSFSSKSLSLTTSYSKLDFDGNNSLNMIGSYITDSIFLPQGKYNILFEGNFSHSSEKTITISCHFNDVSDTYLTSAINLTVANKIYASYITGNVTILETEGKGLTIKIKSSSSATITYYMAKVVVTYIGAI